MPERTGMTYIGRKSTIPSQTETFGTGVTIAVNHGSESAPVRNEYLN